ncbi:S1 family peptidase [Actinophytocola gossypii]|uniref:Trypsin-like serine protease n=1 Tax=Actinophytocola gossypii TaxID=2812003 RepID=A0ABT2JEH9_9PSEU|nr:trypsin-like serine protease [Actinophytocola gossypii]MCT2586281.1 trypsin-like serine protease [Actinophytocola gossypii]
MRFVRVGAALVGAAAAVLGFLAPSAAADEPTVGPAIIDGGYAENAPWAARLFVNGQENCSATIIAPTWILTAEHCVAGGGTVSFNIGSLDQTQGEQATAVNIHTHGSADLALAELDHAVSATYSPLGTAGAVAVGQTVQVYGWGATCTDQPEINCQSQMLKVADVGVNSVSCSDYRGGVAVCANRIDGITAGGDSGGPMFATSPVDGGYYQVGVASTSDRATRTAYTNVTQYRDWIAGIAGV